MVAAQMARAFRTAPPPGAAIDWFAGLSRKRERVLLALGPQGSASIRSPDVFMLVDLIAIKNALLTAMFMGALALFADQLLLDLDQGPGVFLRVGRWISSCQI
jgi:hypothetical protein